MAEPVTCAYASQWPRLSAATNGMDPRLIHVIKENPEYYSVDVRVELAGYEQYCTEYEEYLKINDLVSR
jgi:hypothetical protein